MKTPTILAFAGSARSGSVNFQVLQVAAAAAEGAGATVDRVQLHDYPMPLFDQDLEEREGLPEAARQLKAKAAAADGFLIASPEYNSSLTPLMKNTLDWLSRSETEDEPPCAVYKKKVAGLLAASPGGVGGMRGLFHLRAILQNIGTMVIPSMATVPGAMQVLENGTITDDSLRRRVEGVAVELVQTCRILIGS